MTIQDAPASTALSDELWISLASLLRSHVAMHGIAQPGSGLRTLSSSNAEVVTIGPRGKLQIVRPDRTSAGTVEFRPESAEASDEYETFYFTQNGNIHFQHVEAAMEMEAAVEHLLHKVVQAWA